MRSYILTTIYHLLKYPLSIIMMFILIKFLYTMAPSIRIKSKYMNNGAIFTTLSWFLLTRIYSYHLNNYSNYNLYYGSLSNILILLVWVYLLAYIFMIGLSLNADNYFFSKQNQEKLKIKKKMIRILVIFSICKIICFMIYYILQEMGDVECKYQIMKLLEKEVRSKLQLKNLN